MTKLYRSCFGILLIAQLFFGCTNTTETTNTLKTGKWRGELHPQGQDLPFEFEIEKQHDKYIVYIINVEERLKLDSITVSGDSIKMSLHIFDADLVARIYADSMAGYWSKNFADDYKIPFTATFGDAPRFKANSEQQPQNFSGKYAATFVHNQTDTVKAIGIFEQQGAEVTGTFLTPTGDYRYLKGVADGNQLKLSTFDGEHAFLFVATMKADSTLTGEFWSGRTWHEPWTAYKDDNAVLPDEEQLTYLKEGYTKIDFQFPDLEGNLVSPSDPRFENKVLVLQLFGTWCPNCMDETKFLSDWYNKNKQRGVEILGLAYETKDDYEYAKSRVMKMKNKLGVNYNYVIAGTKDKEAASKTLPMLNEISAFPTFIIIDKKGEVRKIHTGFKGPGTGVHYELFTQSFNATMDQLLNEQ